MLTQANQCQMGEGRRAALPYATGETLEITLKRKSIKPRVEIGRDVKAGRTGRLKTTKKPIKAREVAGLGKSGDRSRNAASLCQLLTGHPNPLCLTGLS